MTFHDPDWFGAPFPERAKAILKDQTNRLEDLRLCVRHSMNVGFWIGASTAVVAVAVLWVLLVWFGGKS